MPPPVLRPVSRVSAEAQATASLRAYILSGALDPGARLTEIPLAARLGVARATLRMALQRLVAEGLVVLLPYAGWQVMRMSPHDVWELSTLRGSLESLAARIAAGRMTDPGRARIAAAMADLEDACRGGAMDAVNEHDFAFHRTIVELAGHARLAAHYATVEQQVRFYIASTNALNEDDATVIVQDHRPLADALINGDPDAAARAAWALNEMVGRKLARLVAQRQEAGTGAPGP